MRIHFDDLSLGAQTSYAELYDMARSLELARFATVRGSFHRRLIKRKTYIYFNFRDVSGRGRSVYVGPDTEPIQSFVDDYVRANVPGRVEALSRRAQACIALGCTSLPERQFRIIWKLASCGLFRSGGVLVGQLAFTAIGNVLGVGWRTTDKVSHVDPSREAQDITLVLPAAMEPKAYGVIESLEMGLLPTGQMSVRSSSQRADISKHDVNVNLLTPHIGSDREVYLQGMGVTATPAKFSEFLLAGTVQGVVFAKSGACLLNLPDPARFVVHNLIVCGKCSVAGHKVSPLDLEQAAALIRWHVQHGRVQYLGAVWNAALSTAPSLRRLANAGRQALRRVYPDQEAAFLSLPPTQRQ